MSYLSEKDLKKINSLLNDAEGILKNIKLIRSNFQREVFSHSRKNVSNAFMKNKVA